MHEVTESIRQIFQHKKDCTACTFHPSVSLHHVQPRVQWCTTSFSPNYNLAKCSFIANHQILVSPIFIVIQYIGARLNNVVIDCGKVCINYHMCVHVLVSKTGLS